MPDKKINVRIWRDQYGNPYLVRVSQFGYVAFFYKTESKDGASDLVNAGNPNAKNIPMVIYNRLRAAAVNFLNQRNGGGSP